MFDKSRFDEMPKFSEFTYWFRRINDTEFEYGPVDSFVAGIPNTIGIINSNPEFMSAPADVVTDFEKYMNRPEFLVGQKAQIVERDGPSNSPEYMIDLYEQLIVGISLMRCMQTMRDPDSGFANADSFLKWLRSTDFFYCPGSTRFHDAFPYGLVFHSLHVYNNIIELRKINKFKNTDLPSAALIALCHDLTKIGNYEQYMKNVKNPDTGKWDQVPSFRWKANPFPFGHGVASMYILTQFFKLSMEEMLAIRWHMAEYRVADQDAGELEIANEQYPLVRLVQFADQLACVKY